MQGQNLHPVHCRPCMGRSSASAGPDTNPSRASHIPSDRLLQGTIHETSDQSCPRCEAAEARLLRHLDRRPWGEWRSIALVVLMLVSIALAALAG